MDMRGQAGWPRTFPPQFDSKGKIRPKRVFVFYQPAIIKKVSRSILYIWQLCLRPVTPPSGRWWVVRPLSTKKRRSETPLFSSPAGQSERSEEESSVFGCTVRIVYLSTQQPGTAVFGVAGGFGSTILQTDI